jgi:hypothetical protein
MSIKRIIRLIAFVVILLTIPLVAMQLTDEINWSLGDFAMAGALLFGLGLALELVKKKVSNKVHRVIAVLILVMLSFLIWAELGVGIFGTPFAGL